MREALLPVLLVLPVGLDVPLLDGELLTSLDSDTLEVDLLNPFSDITLRTRTSEETSVRSNFPSDPSINPSILQTNREP